MVRVIPKKHNVGIELLNGLSLLDILVGFIGFIIAVLIMMSNISFKIYAAGTVACFFIMALIDLDGEKGYQVLYYVVKYLISPKVFVRKDSVRELPSDINVNQAEKKQKKQKSSNKSKTYYIDDILDVVELKENKIIYKDGQQSYVVKIKPMFFDNLSDATKNALIDRAYARAMRLLNVEQTMQFVKIDIPIIYDRYIDNEKTKLNDLMTSYRNGALSKEETAIRTFIVDERINYYKRKNSKETIYEPSYFLVLSCKNSTSLDNLKNDVLTALNNGGINAVQLNTRDIAIFLKANYTKKFNPRDAYGMDESDLLKWIIPKKIVIRSREIIADDIYMYNFKIGKFPNKVEDAWARGICNIQNSRVVFNITPVEHAKAVRQIDRSIDELTERSAHVGKTSKSIDIYQHVQALTNVMTLLQSSNEAFFDVNVYMTIYDYRRSKVEKLPDEIKKNYSTISSTRKDVIFKVREFGFGVADGFLKQLDTFISSQVTSTVDAFKNQTVGLYGSVLAASFPFISQKISDVGGVNIGVIENSPAVFDFFKRDDKHINSNMMVIGKSGSGKSYFTKVLLSNLAAENSKIFILDPENEYSGIINNYKGKKINLATSVDGVINPFQIVPLLDEETDDDYASSEDNNGNKVQESLNLHLQFLEEFLITLMPNLQNEAFEILNNLVRKLYDKDIFIKAKNLEDIMPEQYPIFDDLYNLILSEEKKSDSSMYTNYLKLLANYIEKFATGGRNSSLWNGHSKINTKENLIVFNFQQLLANNNVLICNAQMLLVIHWLNSEIIRNRDFNLRYNTNRKIVVIVDEAHVFINENHPVALDFMYNLAKRIRKYNGMQIVITQNIKDFIGSEMLNRKSTAIINASQYSFIFSLSPDDMNDLYKLYEKSGGLSAVEQRIVVNNGLGDALFIASPTERGRVHIQAATEIEAVFKNE